MGRKNWIEIVFVYFLGIILLILKLLYLDIILYVFAEIPRRIYCKRTAGFGVVNKLRHTIEQAPELPELIKYAKMDYTGNREKVALEFKRDFGALIWFSLKYRSPLYIETNEWMYKNVLIPMQEEKLLKIEEQAGSERRVPQIIEKLQIMDWKSTVRCFIDKKAFKRLFREEILKKYKLEKKLTALLDRKAKTCVLPIFLLE
jgi:hypothetical protein